MGNFKYFTKFPVYRVNKIYLIVTAGQLSRLERRSNIHECRGFDPHPGQILFLCSRIIDLWIMSRNIKGYFKYFTKFPVYRVNKIYVTLKAGQLSPLERRANNANVVGSTPTVAKLLLYFHKYSDLWIMFRNIMGHFKYFTKFPVYMVDKIYLLATAGQRQSVRASC